MSAWRVPFVNLPAQYRSLRGEILDAVDSVLSHGNYVLGDEVSLFESLFAKYCGTLEAVAVNSGGDAVFLSLLALGIGPGDEVITAPNSFIATAWAIANTGARVVFADVTDSYNISPYCLEEAITNRTKAIIPVHLTGRPAAMHEINAIARKHGLLVIEDAAQAAGACFNGVRTGALGDVGCFSLHPLKNLHVYGDGGVITTSRQDVAERLRLLRNHGLCNRDEAVVWGYNSRLDSVQAAIAVRKLSHLDSINDRFRAVANFYRSELRDYVIVPEPEPHEVCVYHRFVVRAQDRDNLLRYLAASGIEAKIHYPIPLHLQRAAKSLGYAPGDFPCAERLAKEIISLPIYAEIPQEHAELVVEGVKSFYRVKKGKGV